MAEEILEFGSIWHNYEKYSPENIQAHFEELRAKGTAPEDISKLERLFSEYPYQFPALYRIKSNDLSDKDAGESLSMTFREVSYRRPEIETEKGDTTLPKNQLELECTLKDGTTFGLSALPATPKTADKEEPALLKGQLSLSEETLKSLNDEKFKNIMDFCHEHGFSTFSIDIATHGGEIDIDSTLAALLQKYQSENTMTVESETFVKPSEDEHDEEGARKEDFVPLVDEAVEEKEHIHDGIPAKRLSLNEMVGNMRVFIEKDLQKRKGLSYWEHVKTIDGRKAYVFSLYDKESADNWKEDGRKNKDGVYTSTASCRIMVSQDKSGKFFFGYATPNGAKMNESLAGDLIGEIQKAGTTHLNFSNIPNQDKVTWLNACAEKGIVPTGLSYSKSKVEGMLEKAQKKLSTEEYATFVERLMDQWEENAAKKGKPLPVSDQEYIRKCRNDALNKREGQEGLLEKAEFERKFKNFRDSYDAADGLLMKVNKLILNGSMDRRSGAATAIAAMTTLARTFDVVLGTADNKNNALDVTLGERMDELLRNPLKDGEGRPVMIRLTEEEKRILTPLAGKKIKDLNKEDYNSIFDLLYKRQLKQTKQTIVEIIKGDLAGKIHVKEHLLVEQRVWNGALGSVRLVNENLRKIGAGVEALTLPDKHSGLPVDELRAIAEKELETEKAAAEAAKGAPVKPTPERGREAR